MKWSIIIPCGNDPEGLRVTIETVKQYKPAKFDGEVIVVNDGAHHEVDVVSKSYGSLLVCCSIAVSGGSYAARNYGVKVSAGRYCAFVDAGCWLDEKWFLQAEKAVMHADYVAGEITTDKKMCVSIAEKYSFLFEFNVDKYFSEDGFGPTANLIMSRELLNYVGGFNERLWSGGDRDMGLRVGKCLQYSKFYDPLLVVFHEPRNLEALVKKEKRIVLGFKGLKKIYPEHFPAIHVNVFRRYFIGIYKVLIICLPPRLTGYSKPLTSFGLYSAIKIYFFRWGLKIFNGYLAVSGKLGTESSNL